MRNRRLVGPSAFTLIVLSVTAASPARAVAQSVAPALPLSHLEQTARLSGLASQTLGRKLFPRPVQTIAPTPYNQLAWIPEPITRADVYTVANKTFPKLAADIENFRRISSDPTLRGSLRGRIAELDWINRNAKNGWRLVKSAIAPQNDAYRFVNGRLEGAQVKVHKDWHNYIRSMRKDNLAERFVLPDDHFDLVYRELEIRRVGALRGGLVEKAAEYGRQQQRLTKMGRTFAELDDPIGTADRAIRLKYRAARGVAVLGLAGAVALGWDAHQQAREAWSMFHDPTLRGTVLPYMQTSVAFGKGAEATTLGLGTGAELGLLGRGGFKALGKTAGKWLLPIAVVVEGLSARMAYHEYSTGRIGQREFYRRSTGPAIFAVFTTGGGIIGGILGTAAAGGAGAVPVQFAADWTLNWYYREFDEQQQRKVDLALERFYGLPE